MNAGCSNLEQGFLHHNHEKKDVNEGAVAALPNFASFFSWFALHNRPHFTKASSSAWILSSLGHAPAQTMSPRPFSRGSTSLFSLHYVPFLVALRPFSRGSASLFSLLTSLLSLLFSISAVFPTGHGTSQKGVNSLKEKSEARAYELNKAENVGSGAATSFLRWK